MFFSARSSRRSSISTAASVSFGLAHNKRRRSALPTLKSDAASPTLIDPFARFARGENVSKHRQNRWHARWNETGHSYVIVIPTIS